MAPLRTILVVDDDELMRKTISRILSHSGYQPIEAHDGLQAYECVRRFRTSLQLVITDIRMPRMSGAELTQRLRNEYPDVKILCVSGYTDPLMVKGDYFLAKPFTVAALRAIVQEALGVPESPDVPRKPRSSVCAGIK